MDQNYAAIVPVAGLSSRMGSFKPLLELNGFPMIELTVQSALDGGAETVCVVTGRNAKKVAAALPHNDDGLAKVTGLEKFPASSLPHLMSVQNPQYAKSDMLQSIKLGLAALLKRETTQEALHSVRMSRTLFVIPGDMPGVSPRTFAALRTAYEEGEYPVLVPTYKGERGHPLLISSACYDAVLTFEGEGGIRQALADYDWFEVPVDDPGILLDADTPDAFDELAVHVRATRGISKVLCEELFTQHHTPSNVQAHTSAVAEVALRMAVELNRQGYGLDSMLCYAGAYLHDLNRVEPKHSEVAEGHLNSLGYTALATVVGAHDKELVLSPSMFTEANLVFVADKLVKETTLVSIEHRYEGALKRFPLSTPLGKLIQQDSESSQLLLEEYVKETGDAALLQGTTEHVPSSYSK